MPPRHVRYQAALRPELVTSGIGDQPQADEDNNLTLYINKAIYYESIRNKKAHISGRFLALIVHNTSY